MKLSLAWIFDHITTSVKDIAPEEIVRRFGSMVAEVEHFEQICYPIEHFFAATLIKVDGHQWIMDIQEINTHASLPARTDYSTLIDPDHAPFLLKKDGEKYTWATLRDFNIDKDGLMPTLDIPPDQHAGTWRSLWQEKDWILTIDNIALSHRPDLWGHRGIAREIAAIMDLSMRSENELCSPMAVVHEERTAHATHDFPITITHDVIDQCTAFSGTYFPSVTNRPSKPHIARRLMMIGARPINALVDLTNYVMHDWSQPVHAYDASTIKGKEINVRRAKPGETLDLLGDITITLESSDLVIADARDPLCLAGIKGGKFSGINNQTTSVFFEVGNFDAGTVRKSVLHHKVRTDSSARFEKTLSPWQLTQTAARFVRLLEQNNIPHTVVQPIIVVGNREQPCIIELSHAYLERLAGITFSSETVTSILHKLECAVTTSITKDNAITYAVTVPSFRKPKGMTNNADLVEEIIRLYGLEKITPSMPAFSQQNSDLSSVTKIRSVKTFLAFGACMIEQQNYPFFDERFLSELKLEVTTPVHIANPISEFCYRMVSSLIPGLLKNVKENHVLRSQLAYFEAGRIWTGTSDNVLEQQSLAGIIFKKRSTVSFYEGKEIVCRMFSTFGIDSKNLVFQQLDAPHVSWYRPFCSAQIMFGDVPLGYLGMVDQTILTLLDCAVPVDAFIFECHLDALLAQNTPKRFVPPSKYQETYVDVSTMMPLTVSMHTVINALRKISNLVHNCELIDIFQKEDWIDQRSLTVRLWLSSHEKTLEKSEIDVVWQAAVVTLEHLGGHVRVE